MNDKGLTLEKYTEIIGSLPLLKEQAVSMSSCNKEKFFNMCTYIDEYSNTKEKGEKLENLVFFIIQNTVIFNGYKNIRTSTNEIDIIVELSDLGNMMLSNKVIDLKSSQIIIECKSYDKTKIDVTWVGKFCSLVLNSPARVGLLISHKGFKGKGKWDSSKGLAKKFFYYKEKYEEKKYILDITLDEIKKSVRDNSFVELILYKIIGMENDTDYKSLIREHPAEEELGKRELV